MYKMEEKKAFNNKKFKLYSLVSQSDDVISYYSDVSMIDKVE